MLNLQLSAIFEVQLAPPLHVSSARGRSYGWNKNLARGLNWSLIIPTPLAKKTKILVGNVK